MSEALRSVFMELGFDVKTEVLEDLEKRLRSSLKATNALATGTDTAAAKTKKKLAEIAEASKKLAKAADQSKTDHEAKKLFDASDEGKAHAAWKRLAEVEEAAKKPVTGLLGLMEKLHNRTQFTIGKALPASFQNAFKKMGVAEGDFAAMGEVATGGALAVALAVKRATLAAIEFSDKFSEDAEALRDTARESRVTTTELQELRHAAAQGGVGVDRMNSGLATFGQSLRAAERWGNGTTATLRRLGIQARDSAGHIRPTGDILNEVAVAMEHIESPTRRVRVATQLFGEAGRRMLDILHTGPGGIRALRDELAELGGGITPEATAAAREYTQATEKMARAQDSLRSVLAVTLLPALSWVVEKLAYLGGFVARMTNGTHVLQVAFAALGVVAAAVAIKMVAMFAVAMAPALGYAAAVLAVTLAMDDLITFAQGGDSAIGRFVDSMFGVGTSVGYARALREEWEEMINTISRAIGAVSEFLGLTERQAQGRLSGPQFGTPRSRAAAARVAARSATATPFGPAVNLARVATVSDTGHVIAPLSQSVAMPGGARGSHTTVVRQHTSAPVMHFHGVTDANVIADRVRTVIREEDRNARDGDAPVGDHDDE